MLADHVEKYNSYNNMKIRPRASEGLFPEGLLSICSYENILLSFVVSFIEVECTTCVRVSCNVDVALHAVVYRAGSVDNATGKEQRTIIGEVARHAFDIVFAGWRRLFFRSTIRCPFLDRASIPPRECREIIPIGTGIRSHISHAFVRPPHPPAIGLLAVR